MHAIVIGAGEVGLNVARTLVSDGHDLTVVDSDAEIASSVQAQLDALVVEGNGASPQTLRRVGAESADLLAAVTQVDEVNIIAALAAKQLGCRQAIARVRDPEFFGPDAGFSRDVLGIDFVIDPDRATAADIVEAILLPGAVSVEYFGDGRLGLADVIVTEQSAIADTRLKERQRPDPAFIVGIVRNGQARLSGPEMVPEPGDHVLVVAPREHLTSTVKRLAGTTRGVRDAVLFGGGKIGLHLARLLEPTSVRVTMFERDAERARFLAERLPHTTVLHEEGVSREAQLAAGVNRADAFVACAGDDRANLLATLHAKQLGASLCLSVVSREEFVPLVDALHIDSAFSPRLIAAEAILGFVHAQTLRGMHLLRSGFEALELEAPPGSAIVGRALGETGGLLRGCRVGAILRDDEVIIPQRGTGIRAGDRVLMLGIDGALAGLEPAFTADR